MSEIKLFCSAKIKDQRQRNPELLLAGRIRLKFRRIKFTPYGSLKLILRTKFSQIWPRGYKTFFKLSSAEHAIYTADKC